MGTCLWDHSRDEVRKPVQTDSFPPTIGAKGRVLCPVFSPPRHTAPFTFLQLACSASGLFSPSEHR